LVTYDWPGNVRELERPIERTVTRSDVISLDDLPVRLRAGYGEVLLPSIEGKETLRAWGSRYVQLVLERSGCNKRRACRSLGISYHTLQACLRYDERRQKVAQLHAGRDAG
jgi:transcriptional regulator with PAS, ATPase and Fis domain